MGFEGFEFSEASLAEVGSEAGPEQEDILQSPAPPSVTTASDVGLATVQRKIVSPPIGTASPAIPTARGEVAAIDAQMQAHIQPLEPRAVLSVAPLPSVGPNVTNRAKWVASSISSVGAPDMADAHDVSLSPSGPPMVSPEKNVVADDRPEALSPGDSQTGNASRQFGPGVVHTRSIRQVHQVDLPRLEPSPQAFAEHLEPPPMDASVSANEVGEGPRVIIGRINIEVVPPPAAQQITAAPRPGPLTAASVSVIGPLSGGIRPNLRLSLRHR
jgi:hypothetical protein